MFLITCPHCGPRSQAEFAYERAEEAVVRPTDSLEATTAALYTRANPRDFEWELWRHAYGCRAWIRMRRHRVTHEIAEVERVGAGA
ncbi:sarcosine oxidase subunit delta [Phenylobacterium montanum]|uniref:Sarcosine oxidase subunit delta n=1 Tax=Phenylobacterium montanum TaxID=2823693 RepID=A0A975G4F4_9CAUL|nr:sarcosine oxidase subunit delta [Caulobacter sp. S6]QUD90456.1 sarcosine oxidase subunit delta [Caulobacter sp. S6]